MPYAIRYAIAVLSVLLVKKLTNKAGELVTYYVLFYDKIPMINHSRS
jgi:hypothetical protein